MATVQIDGLNYVIALLVGQNTGSRYGILAREEGADFLWSSLKFETDACSLSRLDDDVLCHAYGIEVVRERKTVACMTFISFNGWDGSFIIIPCSISKHMMIVRLRVCFYGL